MAISSDNAIHRLNTRKAAIMAERERLTKEEAEIDTAIAVLSRYSDADLSEPLSKGESRIGRPAGTPTTFEMVKFALAGSERPLATKELVEIIEKRWWPGLKSAQILPQLHGFLKSNRLAKDDAGRFMLPSKWDAEATAIVKQSALNQPPY